MYISELLSDAVKKDASDIFIVAGQSVLYKINKDFVPRDEKKLMPSDTLGLVKELYQLAGNRDIDPLLKSGDDDFSVALPGISRFRINTFKQRNSLAAVIRVVRFELPDPSVLGIPPIVMNFANLKRGLVLVTGTAGSGKSTTLACLIDHINKTQAMHIVTLEDPLEFLHSHNKSLISQREIASDTNSYIKALRASLRQAPDVILLGEMRDHETMAVSMTAAETGHLVFSTLHTVGAAHTIDRIIDAFPPGQQNQIRIQLSMVLQAVVSQQLILTKDNEKVPVFEVMVVNSAIRNMIREGKVHQIDSVIHSSAAEGMVTMDTSLLNLYKEGKISSATALTYSVNRDLMVKKL